MLYSLGVAYECYLLWGTNDTLMTLLSAYLGFQLICFSTTVPVCILFLLSYLGSISVHNAEKEEEENAKKEAEEKPEEKAKDEENFFLF